MTWRKAQQMEMAVVSPLVFFAKIHNECPMQVAVAAQLPSGNFSQQDLNYRKFWDFLIAEGQASQPLRPELLISRKYAIF
jgi:hypothetical protein